MPEAEKHILTVNSGSSSLKFALYRNASELHPVWSGVIDGIGQPDSSLLIRDASGRTLRETRQPTADQPAALQLLLGWLRVGDGASTQFDAVGHRIVHGGRAYSAPVVVTDEVLAALRQLVPFAPTHLPSEIAAIVALRQAYPDVPQVACFDTAFHRSMPITSQLFGIPRRYFEEGVLRYGFHGLSYEYLMRQLTHEAGADTAQGRVILAHLGNGASMAAVSAGRCVDTTMGLTPMGGLVMGTRSGDLDPGVLLYLAERLDAPALRAAVNNEGGMLGVSGCSADMRTLLEAETHDPAAAQAVILFCHSARKAIGALAAALSGVDTLVFAGGIGENAAIIRRRICDGLDFLGISLDQQRNTVHAPIISREGARVTVRVIKTNEDAMIGLHTRDLLWSPSDQASR